MATSVQYGIAPPKKKKKFIYHSFKHNGISFIGFQDSLCTPLMAAQKNGLDLVQAFANYTNTFWVPIFGAAEQYR